MLNQEIKDVSNGKVRLNIKIKNNIDLSTEISNRKGF